MNKKPNRYTVLLIYTALALATFIAYQQVVHNDFVWDDLQYVTNNPNVKCGITRESVIWAFTTPYASNWHPVTWLSHMLDCELFGVNPFYHHLVNLFFHILNTLLLFWVLKRMTGEIWRSAFVAALFALHPLHVESVAWVAERKDLLCGFFWILTIAAYIRYARHPSTGRYLLVVLVFALGLMAKPMIVTLPFVLLLLDYWPLKRVQWLQQDTDKTSSPADSVKTAAIWRLVCEKIPLLILTAGLVVITIIVQRKSGATELLKDLSLDMRMANGAISYIGYIAKIVYPSRLSALYPHSKDSLLTWQPMISAIVLALLTVSLIYLARKQRRYLAVGWLWYIGTLVPVIGLIQIGMQGMADRYTYMPSIGIFIIAAWGIGELLEKKGSLKKVVVAISAGVVVVTLLIGTRAQVKYWRNNITLFGHAAKVTKDNSLALNNLGSAYMDLGRLDEAALCYKEALRLEPDHLGAHQNLGTVLTRQRKIDEAIEHYLKALQIKPDVTRIRSNLAYLLLVRGDISGAVSHFQKVLEVEPNHFQALIGLAQILAMHSDASIRDPNRAIELAERAAETTNYQNADALDILAAAYAAAGQFPRAVETAQKALDLARIQQKEHLIEKIKSRLSLYKDSKPCIEFPQETD